MSLKGKKTPTSCRVKPVTCDKSFISVLLNIKHQCVKVRYLRRAWKTTPLQSLATAIYTDRGCQFNIFAYTSCSVELGNNVKHQTWFRCCRSIIQKLVLKEMQPNSSLQSAYNISKSSLKLTAASTSSASFSPAAQ